MSNAFGTNTKTNNSATQQSTSTNQNNAWDDNLSQGLGNAAGNALNSFASSYNWAQPVQQQSIDAYGNAITGQSGLPMQLQPGIMTSAQIAQNGLTPGGQMPFYNSMVTPYLQAQTDLWGQQDAIAGQQSAGKAASQGALANNNGNRRDALLQQAMAPARAAATAGTLMGAQDKAYGLLKDSQGQQLSASQIGGGLAGIGNSIYQGLGNLGTGLQQLYQSPMTAFSQFSSSLSPYFQAAGQTVDSSGSSTGKTDSWKNPGWGTVGLGLAGTAMQFSDARIKENIEPVGLLFDGQTPVFKFNFKGDPTPQIGLIAQEVEGRMPEAVSEDGQGLKVVDYEMATRPSREKVEMRGPQLDEPDMPIPSFAGGARMGDANGNGIPDQVEMHFNRFKGMMQRGRNGGGAVEARPGFDLGAGIGSGGFGIDFTNFGSNTGLDSLDMKAGGKGLNDMASQLSKTDNSDQDALLRSQQQLAAFMSQNKAASNGGAIQRPGYDEGGWVNPFSWGRNFSPSPYSDMPVSPYLNSGTVSSEDGFTIPYGDKRGGYGFDSLPSDVGVASNGFGNSNLSFVRPQNERGAVTAATSTPGNETPPGISFMDRPMIPGDALASSPAGAMTAYAGDRPNIFQSGVAQQELVNGEPVIGPSDTLTAADKSVGSPFQYNATAPASTERPRSASVIATTEAAGPRVPAEAAATDTGETARPGYPGTRIASNEPSRTPPMRNREEEPVDNSWLGNGVLYGKRPTPWNRAGAMLMQIGMESPFAAAGKSVMDMITQDQAAQEALRRAGIEEANLTGDYKGQKTLAQRTLEETIRRNKAELDRKSDTEISKALDMMGITPDMPEYKKMYLEMWMKGKDANKSESEYEKVIAKASGADLEARSKAIEDSRNRQTTLNQIEQILQDPNLYTGKAADLVQAAKKWGKAGADALGVKEENLPEALKGIASGELLNTISNKFALTMRTDMPGAMSDSDRNFLLDSVPGMRLTKEGNALIVRLSKQAEQYKMDANQAAMDFIHANKSNVGLQRYMNQWMKDNPMVSSQQMEQIKRAVSAPEAQQAIAAAKAQGQSGQQTAAPATPENLKAMDGQVVQLPLKTGGKPVPQLIMTIDGVTGAVPIQGPKGSMTNPFLGEWDNMGSGGPKEGDFLYKNGKLLRRKSSWNPFVGDEEVRGPLPMTGVQ